MTVLNEMPIIPGLNGMIRETLETAAKRQLKKKIIGFVVKWIPFLGGSFFSPLVALAAGKAAEELWEEVSNWADMALIDLYLYTRDYAYRVARDKARELFLKPREPNDSEELEKLRKEMEDRAAELIRIRTIAILD